MTGPMHRLAWNPPYPLMPSEMKSDNVRSLAMGIEDAISKDKGGISMETPVAKVVVALLWDLADRVDLDR